MYITLTPGQAVTLHGWWSPSLSLHWRDVVEKDDITFRRCREVNIPLKQLHLLQPDVAQWVQYGGLTVAHAQEVCDLWQCNPITDLRADLADVLSMGWKAETLRRMGVTYAHLCEAGMTPETMRMFGFSMLGWINLGFRTEDLRLFTDAQVTAVFLLSRQAAERCFVAERA